MWFPSVDCPTTLRRQKRMDKGTVSSPKACAKVKALRCIPITVARTIWTILHCHYCRRVRQTQMTIIPSWHFLVPCHVPEDSRTYLNRRLPWQYTPPRLSAAKFSKSKYVLRVITKHHFSKEEFDYVQPTEESPDSIARTKK